MGPTRMGLVALPLVITVLVSMAAGQSSSCEGAAFLPPPYVEKVVGGTTARKLGSNDGCSGGSPADTYKITPSQGNSVTIKACGPLTLDSYLRVTVYTGSCSSPSCLEYSRLMAMTECVRDSDRLEFEVNESVYWVVVESDSDVGGQYSLSINEGIIQRPMPGCEDAITIAGPYNPPVSFYSSIGPSTYDDPDDDSQWVTVSVIDSFDYGDVTLSLYAATAGDIPAEDYDFGPGGSWDVRLVSAAILGGVPGASVDVLVGQGSWNVVCDAQAYCSSTAVYTSYSSIDVLQGPATAWRITYSSTGGGEIGVTVLDVSHKEDIFVVQLEDCSGCEAIVTFSDLAVGVDLSQISALGFGTIGSNINVDITEVALVAQERQRSPDLVTDLTLPCSGTPVTTQLAWFKIYPQRGEVTVSTNHMDLVPTQIDIYEGQCGDLVCVPYTYSSQTSVSMTVSFNSYAAMYFVVVSGRGGAIGTYELTVREEPFSDFFTSTEWDSSAEVTSWVSPSAFTSWRSASETTDWSTGEESYGSACNDPIIAGYGSSFTEYNSGSHYGNLCGLYSSSGSTWFSFNPNSNDRVTIDSCSCNFDTVLAVVSDCSSLSCIASNDDNCSNDGSSVTMDVTGGREYLIFVAGYGSSHGSFVLNIRSL